MAIVLIQKQMSSDDGVGNPYWLVPACAATGGAHLIGTLRRKKYASGKFKVAWTEQSMRVIGAAKRGSERG
ncbi:hypothetical protein [Pandoraea anhela]|uniref:hypothetical protein n=1 Tax=Pandoraea anhela TaxID=2508295 RepID=UPI00123F7CE1|nr:hypothetical protein [Pandoraea anhela]